MEAENMMDEYRREWALRFIREAKAELEAARKIPYMAPRFLAEAVRKAQSAVYYSLGEPAYMENLVKELRGQRKMVTDPILRCIISIDENVQILMQQEFFEGKDAMKRAGNLVKLASEIVETLTGEKPRN